MRQLRIQQSGFTLIEVLIAMFVLMVGLLAISGLVGLGLVHAMQAKELSVAQQLAAEAIEAVATARLLGTLQFSDIRNVSRGGIFLDGYQPIRLAGPDGLVNTADDRAAGPVAYIDPGRDGRYNTADDTRITFDKFERQVLITDEDRTLRRITVNVRYTFRGLTSVTSVTMLLSNIN